MQRRPAKRPPRPLVHLTGGPLDGIDARIPLAWLIRGRVLIPCFAGRYVRTDTDELNWELDHHPEKEQHHGNQAHARRSRGR